jgi:hypothetical protein
MHYREDLAEFERRLLLHIEGRSERQSEWRRLRCLQRHRQLHRLGLITLVFCFALLAAVLAAVVVVVFTVFLVLL